MNEAQRLELERLKQEHARLGEKQSMLQQDLSSLSRQLTNLESLLKAQATAAQELPSPEPQSVRLQPAAPLPKPPVISQVAVPVPPPMVAKVVAAPPPFEPEFTIEPPPVLSGPERGSFEMRLGTYWFVRVGIVMVLTALVFFGNFAYQKFIVNLGPGGKVFLLYLASSILLGAGAWWQRKASKESLKNYAQVLFAGGLAAVYFTTYAAHYFEHLRVIQDAFMDGLLLLGWAGFIVWVADRRKSEVLGLFAVGL